MKSPPRGLACGLCGGWHLTKQNPEAWAKFNRKDQSANLHSDPKCRARERLRHRGEFARHVATIRCRDCGRAIVDWAAMLKSQELFDLALIIVFCRRDRVLASDYFAEAYASRGFSRNNPRLSAPTTMMVPMVRSIPIPNALFNSLAKTSLSAIRNTPTKMAG
jgi:hypothetical protein